VTQLRPKFSVCIPAYNRATVLPVLLESILSQDFSSFEVVINEDGSPERQAIREVVERYSSLYPGRIRYFENERNLGYDANLRSLVERSRGEYCVFMGNDDLMCPGALSVINGAVSRHTRIGVFLRSYAAFDGEPGNIVQTFRYFDREIFFPAGADAIGTLYRRSVVIPGVTLNREAALKYATDRFDGTLLYQIYLVANILVDWNGVYSPEVVTLYRNGGVPDFGNSAAEKGRFVPRTRTTESSVHFMRGMLDIARHVETTRGVAIYKNILKDISNYSYPVLAVQADKSFGEFFGYYVALIKLGFGRHFLFHAYFFSILLLGTGRVERIIAWVKRRLGYTPVLGSVYTGTESRKY
jgi:glycosyltransferase involved in cell wall biosynthesis